MPLEEGSLRKLKGYFFYLFVGNQIEKKEKKKEAKGPSLGAQVCGFAQSWMDHLLHAQSTPN